MSWKLTLGQVGRYHLQQKQQEFRCIMYQLFSFYNNGQQLQLCKYHVFLECYKKCIYKDIPFGFLLAPYDRFFLSLVYAELDLQKLTNLIIRSGMTTRRKTSSQHFFRKLRFLSAGLSILHQQKKYFTGLCFFSLSICLKCT